MDEPSVKIDWPQTIAILETTRVELFRKTGFWSKVGAYDDEEWERLTREKTSATDRSIGYWIRHGAFARETDIDVFVASRFASPSIISSDELYVQTLTERFDDYSRTQALTLLLVHWWGGVTDKQKSLSALKGHFELERSSQA